MSVASHYDVVIAGAGIAGCALAARLAPLGLGVLVLEAGALASASPAVAADIAAVDPRVSALNAASRRLLEQAGAWDGIAPRARCAYRAMRVWEEDGSAAIGFDATEAGVSELGHIVENRWITGALLTRLAQTPQVRVLGNERLLEVRSEPGAEPQLVLASGARLSAGLLIGADGAHSAVRERCGIAAPLRDSGQQAIVATIRTAQSHRHTAWQRFLQSGPLALLPLDALDDGRCCSIVWSADVPVAQELMSLDDAAFARRLTRACESCAGAVLEVTRRIAFPLRALHAESYVAPGVALIGDAAHVVHPLAGQGINLGLADVETLVQELSRAIARGEAPGDPGMLARYERRRRGENALMLRAMEGFQKLFADDRVPVRLLRSLGLGAVAGFGPLKREFMRRAMGLG